LLQLKKLLDVGRNNIGLLSALSLRTTSHLKAYHAAG
jgi:hypothetical protein